MPLPGAYKLEEVLSAEEIASRVHYLAADIDAYYQEIGAQEITLVCVLRGACVFFVDLLREIKTTAVLDFLQASSYVGDHSSGELHISKDIGDISGKHVLLVEDILDTGFTMKLLFERLQQRNPASLKLCALLDKTEARKYDVQADFVGFEVPERFLVGYGLDYDENFRGLPYIGELILA